MSQRQPFAPSRPASRASAAQHEELEPTRRAPTVPTTPGRPGYAHRARNPSSGDDQAPRHYSHVSKPLNVSTISKKLSQSQKSRILNDMPAPQAPSQQSHRMNPCNTSPPHIFTSPPLQDAHIASPVPSRLSPPFVANGLLDGEFKMPALPVRRTERIEERAHITTVSAPMRPGSSSATDHERMHSRLNSSNTTFYDTPHSEGQFEASSSHGHPEGVQDDNDGLYEVEEVQAQQPPQRGVSRSAPDFDTPNEVKRPRAVGPHGSLEAYLIPTTSWILVLITVPDARIPIIRCAIPPC